MFQVTAKNIKRHSLSLREQFLWYPPAESRIPLSAIMSSFLPGADHFKNKLCTYLNVDHCILANSGRGLLTQLFNELKEMHPWCDEVLVPGYTCYSVPAAIVRSNLKVRVYDLDPNTLYPDMDTLGKGIRENTLAIIVQHLFGIPSPLDGIRALAKKQGVCLIEDAAQALGGTTKGSFMGSVGDFGLYSFGRGKPLPLGCGGAIVGNKSVLERIEEKPPVHGWKSVALMAAVQIFSHPCLYGVAEALPLGLGETIFDPGFDISSMNMASRKLGESSLYSLEGMNKHRNIVAAEYIQLLRKDRVFPVEKDAKPVFTRFPVIGGGGDIPSRLKRLGVRRMYPKALMDEPSIRPYIVNSDTTTKGAGHLARSLITLPTNKHISPILARRIARDIREYYQC